MLLIKSENNSALLRSIPASAILARSPLHCVLSMRPQQRHLFVVHKRHLSFGKKRDVFIFPIITHRITHTHTQRLRKRRNPKFTSLGKGEICVHHMWLLLVFGFCFESGLSQKRVPLLGKHTLTHTTQVLSDVHCVSLDRICTVGESVSTNAGFPDRDTHTRT